MLLSDTTELRIGELTVLIDRLLCVGFGDCMDELPTPFEFDDEGIAIFTADAGELPRDYVLTACDVCPVDALTVLDANGDQLVP